VTRRVIEGVGEDYDPVAEHYTEDLGMDVLRRFGDALLAMERKLLADCLDAVVRTAMTAEEFGAALRVLAQIYGLGRALLGSGVGRPVAAGAVRAAERAEQLLRPQEILAAVDAMVGEMDQLLATRVPSAQRRVYAGLFAGFKAQTGVGSIAG
jgi:hypothetical protein